MFIYFTICCICNDKRIVIKYKKYVGGQVYNFLLDDEIRRYSSFVFFDTRPGMLTGARLELSNKDAIEIIVTEFSHIKPFDINRDWSKNLFYAETISEIKVYREGRCVSDFK